MSNIINPFAIPIYQDLINKKFFDIIRKDTYSFIAKNQDLFEEPWLCPTKTTINHPKSMNINIPILENTIKTHIENYFKLWMFRNPIKLILKDIWVNLAPNLAYQEEHHHNNNLFSGVLYIDVNEHSGIIEFMNPLQSSSILMDSPLIFNSQFKITPLNGMILLFPGWLNHRVGQNKSDKDRISISFNIKAIE